MLVVDDNRDAAETPGRDLGTRPRDVAWRYDGPTALIVAAQFRPHIALLDIGLPVMDGYELARRLRDEPDCGVSSSSPLRGTGKNQTANAHGPPALTTTSSNPSTWLDCRPSSRRPRAARELSFRPTCSSSALLA